MFVMPDLEDGQKGRPNLPTKLESTPRLSLFPDTHTHKHTYKHTHTHTHNIAYEVLMSLIEYVSVFSSI